MGNDQSLAGRVAIVTGSGRGIGRSEAIHLASIGAAVVVNDIDDEAAASVVREIETAGGRAFSHCSDVSDWSAAETLVQRTVDVFGHLNLVVNNAGVHRNRSFAETTEGEWELVVKASLGGSVATSRAAVGWWETADGDIDRRIVNTTSLAGIYGAASQTSAYATAKAAVLGLTWSLSRELASRQIGVNAIAPRAATRMNNTKPEFQNAESGRYSADRVAPFVGWLAGPETRGVTGRTFVVGGGKAWIVLPLTGNGPFPLDPATGGIQASGEPWNQPEAVLPTWPQIEVDFA